jgi:tetratricopeptide (TPR) repeat protein
MSLNAQPNCEAYKYYGDELKYKACKTAEKRNGYYQFSRQYQEALDDALEVDSTFAYAYRAKSTAYLKSGDFITWKKLIDKAVEYDPEQELFYRGSCRYQFFRDFSGAINDIELLDSLVDYDIGHSQNGDYHLHILRALCYKALGEKCKAIYIIEQQMQEDSHIVGVYDYLHLGVLKLELGKLEEAIDIFKKQEVENDLAENRFYIALAYKRLGDIDKCLENLNIAKRKYENEIRMFDVYVEKMDQIYLDEIEEEIRTIANNR